LKPFARGEASDRSQTAGARGTHQAAPLIGHECPFRRQHSSHGISWSSTTDRSSMRSQASTLMQACAARRLWNPGLRGHHSRKIQGVLGAGLFRGHAEPPPCSSRSGAWGRVDGNPPLEERIRAFRTLCGLPENVIPLALVVLGYPTNCPVRKTVFAKTGAPQQVVSQLETLNRHLQKQSRGWGSGGA